MKYRYIFVDLDNTLLDFEAAEEYSFYYTAQSRGLSFGEAELERYQAINAPLWKMMERREITKDALVVRRFRELFEELGITGIDPEQYNADYLNNLAHHRHQRRIGHPAPAHCGLGSGTLAG